MGKFKEYEARMQERSRKRHQQGKSKVILDKHKELERRKAKAIAYAQSNPTLVIPDEIRINNTEIEEVGKHLRYNDYISVYYDQLAMEEDDVCFKRNSEAIKTCGKNWFFDHYRMQGVYDLKNVYHCHDKFCLYCQKLLQATRLMKYSPKIEQYISEGKYLYHIVFTMPSVSFFNKTYVKKLFGKFKLLIRYFTSNAKNKLGWEKYGFVGAIRSFEATVNDNKFHPHLHSFWAFDNPLPDDSCKINKYSYNYTDGKWFFARTFTEFEITLQKVWYLLINGIKVTPENISALTLGYSCTVDRVTDNYYEAFKYTVKIYKDDGDFDLTYSQFKTLYFALKGVHIFQGYGDLYRTDVNQIDESMAEKYDYLIAQLQLIEKPTIAYLGLDDIAMKILVNPDVRFISRKRLMQYLKENPDFLKSFIGD